MKSKLIEQIQSEMSTRLNPGQLVQLKKVLETCFQSVMITSAELINPEEAAHQNMQFLSSFISSKKIEGCSERTVQYYTSTITHLFENTEKYVKDITTDDLRNYLSEYQEKNHSGKVTIDNIRRIFSSFFSWLEDEDYIIKSPVRRIHKVKTAKTIKETFSDENLEILRDSCSEIRDRALIELLSSTGMRVGELVRLNRDDIDFNERQCIVFGKGDSEREVYFDAKTKIHLMQYLESRTDPDEALFVSLKKPFRRMSIGSVESRLRKLGQKVNIPKVYPHKFRRTMATMAIDKGMPVEQVQKLLGHVRIDTTMHYAMVSQNNVKMAHRKYIG